MARQDKKDVPPLSTTGSAAALDAVLHAHPDAGQALRDALAASPEYSAWLRQIGSDVPGILERSAKTG